ncbi:hypothetical protein Bbelb_270840 [Branchiostoma belcheri]|nr:hypothetical protein Bbelb_270840 [Branchiostoma belcheri]
MGVVGGPYVTAIDLQFLSKPLGGPSSRHFFPSKRATYHPDFVTPACVDHEISKLEVQLQYHNKPLGGPKTATYRNSFVPYTTRLWNSLPSEMREYASYSQFRQRSRAHILSTRHHQKYRRLGDRHNNILTTRLRLDWSHINSTLAKFNLTSRSCNCGATSETVAHFLLSCPLYEDAQQTLATNVRRLTDRPLSTNILLNGYPVKWLYLSGGKVANFGRLCANSPQADLVFLELWCNDLCDSYEEPDIVALRIVSPMIRNRLRAAARETPNVSTWSHIRLAQRNFPAYFARDGLYLSTHGNLLYYKSPARLIFRRSAGIPYLEPVSDAKPEELTNQNP